jgi:hypothetical protein
MSTTVNDTVPPWPSLYNPGLEILQIQHQPPSSLAVNIFIMQMVGILFLYPFKYFTFRRCLPFHVILDNNFLHPTLPDLRLLCILELCIPTFSSYLWWPDTIDKRRPNVCLGVRFA